MAPPPYGRGWSDIGYHGIIDPDGTWSQGRGFNEQGAHVESENDGNIGICLIGTDLFTRAQFQTLRSKIDSLRMLYDIPFFKIYCHYQFKSAQAQGKTCPNIEINRFLSWYFYEDDAAIQPYLHNGT